MTSIPAVLEDSTWGADVQQHILVWAQSGLIFSAEDIRRSFRQPPHPNMMGRAFLQAQTDRVIERQDSKTSMIRSRNYSRILTWRGTTPITTGDTNE